MGVRVLAGSVMGRWAVVFVVEERVLVGSLSTWLVLLALVSIVISESIHLSSVSILWQCLPRSHSWSASNSHTHLFSLFLELGNKDLNDIILSLFRLRCSRCFK